MREYSGPRLLLAIVLSVTIETLLPCVQASQPHETMPDIDYAVSNKFSQHANIDSRLKSAPDGHGTNSLVSTNASAGTFTANILTDGSFENLNANGEWTNIYHSLFGDNLICDDCNGAPSAAGPYGFVVSGAYLLIAGGTFSSPSTGVATHSPVAIPADATTLEFQWATLHSGAAGPCVTATDGLALSIGGNQVWSNLDATGICVEQNPYKRVVIDLATAPGGPYQGTTVAFEFTASASGIPPAVDITNVMLDDVSINVPSDVPTNSDSDSFFDDVDNCILLANEDQRDTNGDGYGNWCDADLDNNGIVNFADIIEWIPFFNTQCGVDSDADFNGDGFCNFADFNLMKFFFLGPPGPAAIDNF